MSMAPKRGGVQLTYREYALLPDDGRRHELIEGDFYVTPAPSTFHQTVSRRLQYALMTQLEETGIALVFNAPCDVILADTTVVQPDLAIVRLSQRELVSQRAIEGPPNVAVEILSPSSQGQDQFLKRSVYAKFAIPEYWIVDPDHGWVTQLRLDDAATYQQHARLDRASTLTSPELPEISIALAPIFRPF